MDLSAFFGKRQALACGAARGNSASPNKKYKRCEHEPTATLAWQDQPFDEDWLKVNKPTKTVQSEEPAAAAEASAAAAAAAAAAAPTPLISTFVADVIRSVGERLAADDVRAAVSPEEAVDKVLAMIQHFSRQSGDTLVNLAAVAPLMHECAAALHVFTTWPLPDNIWMRPLAELRAMSRAEICSAIAGLGPHDAYVKANGERALTSTSAQVCCCISL